MKSLFYKSYFMHGTGPGMQQGPQATWGPQHPPQQQQQLLGYFDHQMGPPVPVPGPVHALDDPSGEERTPIGGRSAPVPLKFPRRQGMACLKFLDERFDPTLTGNSNQDEIAIIIWLLTGMRPLYPCNDLGCKYWDELFAAIAKGQARKKDIFSSPLIAHTPAARPNLCPSHQAAASYIASSFAFSGNVHEIRLPQIMPTC